jgi:hypothetical protein
MEPLGITSTLSVGSAPRHITEPAPKSLAIFAVAISNALSFSNADELPPTAAFPGAVFFFAIYLSEDISCCLRFEPQI